MKVQSYGAGGGTVGTNIPKKPVGITEEEADHLQYSLECDISIRFSVYDFGEDEYIESDMFGQYFRNLSEMGYLRGRVDRGAELAAFVVLRMEHTFTETIEYRGHTGIAIWTSKNESWDEFRTIVQWIQENGMKIVDEQRKKWREELKDAGML